MTQRKKDQRKERVLHTRVSEKLDSELREKAAGLGVSVSNLVRNILLNTVEMVEDIVADGSSIARAAGKNRTAAADAEGKGRSILGWQALTLNLNALCESCNTVLAKGALGNIAVCPDPGPAIFRCDACLPINEDDNDNQQDNQ